MSDTPRTDDHNWHDGDYDDPLHAFYDFARQLELELNAAHERIKRLERLVDGVHYVDGVHLEEVDGLNWFDARSKAKEAKL